MGFIANAFLIKPYFSGRPGHSGPTLFPHFCWHRYFFQPGCPLALHSNRVSSSPCFHCEFPWKIFKTGNPLISSPRSVSIEMHRITFGVRSCFLYISTILKCLTCETARAIVVPTIFNTGLRLNVYVELWTWKKTVKAVLKVFYVGSYTGPWIWRRTVEFLQGHTWPPTRTVVTWTPPPPPSYGGLYVAV